MDWKPQWLENNTVNVSEAIRNLAMLNWIKVNPSINLPHVTDFEI